VIILTLKEKYDMTIDQVFDKLIDEKQKCIASRFPCRVIMVRNIDKYNELLDKLCSIPDVKLVSLDMLFSAPDVMPRYENLTKQDSTTQWFVLPGVSEYLRLFSKNEATTQRFAKLWSYQAPSSSTGRIIIPLWGCEAQWHDRTLHLTDDIRRSEHYYDCTDLEDEGQSLTLTVFADSFMDSKDSLIPRYDLVVDGLKEWMDYWQKPSSTKKKLALITARYGNICTVSGDISVSVIEDVLEFIKSGLDGGSVLNATNCPDEAQKCLFNYVLEQKTLEEAILSCLNIGIFSGLDVMGKWSTLSIGQKQLVSLWILLHKDASYLCHCVTGANGIQDIEQRILHEIFQLWVEHPDWIAESQGLIRAMKLAKDDIYFKEINQIAKFEDRLPFLSSTSQKERSYLLYMAGKWLREDEVNILENDTVKSIFPALNAYLDGNAYDDEELRSYMKRYKFYKLSNTLPEDEQIYFAGIQPDKYDYRYAVISKNLNDLSVILWIDALGVEWLPLLLWSLQQEKQWSVKTYATSQANLPTETDFNNQWKQMNDVSYDKLDELDTLAHTGVIDDPSYYSCIEQQFRFVENTVCKKVKSLMSDYRRVIITGDHGTSRLAARFFHKRDGFSPGIDAKVCSHGRYALITKNIGNILDSQISVKDSKGNMYLVFSNYDHFIKSGFAAGAEDDKPIYGEVHGGASPEEMLVPVIVVDNNEPLPIVAKWKKSCVKVSMKKAEATIIFNQKVKHIEAKIEANHAAVNSVSNGREWIVTFSNLSKGRYKPTLYADGKLVSIEALEVKSALENSDGDLP